jgi:hypothetical protein
MPQSEHSTVGARSSQISQSAAAAAAVVVATVLGAAEATGGTATAAATAAIVVVAAAASPPQGAVRSCSRVPFDACMSPSHTLHKSISHSAQLTVDSSSLHNSHSGGVAAVLVTAATAAFTS